MSELDEVNVESFKWRILERTTLWMEGIGEGIDQFHLEKQMKNW